jgi:hypothetical protein
MFLLFYWFVSLFGTACLDAEEIYANLILLIFDCPADIKSGDKSVGCVVVWTFIRHGLEFNRLALKNGCNKPTSHHLLSVMKRS